MCGAGTGDPGGLGCRLAAENLSGKIGRKYQARLPSGTQSGLDDLDVDDLYDLYDLDNDDLDDDLADYLYDFG